MNDFDLIHHSEGLSCGKLDVDGFFGLFWEGVLLVGFDRIL